MAQANETNSELAPQKDFFLGLIHYPVVNRRKDTVVSSVTNLDLHDISRASRTYGVSKYFVIHPSEDQQALNRRIVKHWEGSYGQRMNPTRMDAFSVLQLSQSFEEAYNIIVDKTGEKPLCVGTSARKTGAKIWSLPDLKEKMTEKPVFLLLGTAYGLEPSWEARLDAFLPAINGPGDYNHLSVRSAASIYLDRIFGR